jgi:hypothetical protein
MIPRRAACFFLLLIVPLAAQTAPAPQLSGIAGAGSVELGQPVSLQVIFSGSAAGQTYQWRKNVSVLAGATTAAR